MRIAATIEYKGSAYHGFEKQKSGLPTVQHTLEKALSQIANHPVALTVAGRTDAGVHATGQVIHFDSEAGRPLGAWVRGSNALLPRDISVREALAVADDFHARFDATARQYQYHIINRSARVSLQADTVLWVHEPLDVRTMHDAAQYLLGEQDFSAFRASSCQANSPFRHIEEIQLTREGEHILATITGNAFLHHMVRNIIGSLLEVGTGKRAPTWIAEVLASRDRRQAGQTAPARGLVLTAVRYPKDKVQFNR